MSRRAAIAAMGGAGAALLVACSSAGQSASTTTTAAAAGPTSTTLGASTSTALAGCAVLTQEQEQGPFYYEAAKVRSDITDGKTGAPMQLRLTVMDINTCEPVPNAAVDVWQADALGNYSDTGTGLFLRGIQITDANGVATFTSIYPGWYPSRTNHVHVKVHLEGTASATYSGGHVSHTGNLFFPEDISLAVAKVAPYTDNPTKDRVTLTSDFVYKGQSGSGSIMTLTPVNAADPTAGCGAAMVLGIDPAATPSSIGIAGTVN